MANPNAPLFGGYVMPEPAKPNEPLFGGYAKPEPAKPNEPLFGGYAMPKPTAPKAGAAVVSAVAPDVFGAAKANKALRNAGILLAFVAVGTVLAGVNPQLGHGILALFLVMLLIRSIQSVGPITEWVGNHTFAP